MVGGGSVEGSRSVEEGEERNGGDGRGEILLRGKDTLVYHR